MADRSGDIAVRQLSGRVTSAARQGATDRREWARPSGRDALPGRCMSFIVFVLMLLAASAAPVVSPAADPPPARPPVKREGTAGAPQAPKNKPPAKAPDAKQPPAQKAPAKKAATEPAGAGEAGSKLLRERWDVILASGKKIGYGRTRETELVEDGQTLRQIHQQQFLVVRRFGDLSKSSIEAVSVETPAGQVVRFSCKLNLGPMPQEFTARVHDDRAVLECRDSGKLVTTELDWPAEARGTFGMEQSLAESPLEAGAERSLKLFDVTTRQLVSVKLRGEKYEKVDVLGSSLELLRVTATMIFPDGNKLTGDYYMDKGGEILKSRIAQMETVRCARETALGKWDPAPFDLGVATTVKLKEKLTKGHAARQIRYRVRLGNGDPAELFPQSLTQKVKQIDKNSAEISVIAIRPGHPALETAKAEKATEEDLRPCPLLQSDDPLVAKMAEEAAAGEPDSWSVAVALERAVRESVKVTTFSTAFASAAEVAKSGEGDCTEHAVLLAAMARARGIPSRVVVGLVYIETQGAFGFHMWDELLIDDAWMPLDGTLARGGIGAAHIRVAHTNLAGASAYSALMPVAQLLGQLKIEVLGEE